MSISSMPRCMAVDTSHGLAHHSSGKVRVLAGVLHLTTIVGRTGTSEGLAMLPILAIHTPAGYPLTRLPVVCLTCFICGLDIPKGELHDPDVNVSRVGGNSANGYEAYHASCLDAHIDSLDEEIPDDFEVDAEEEEDILRCEADYEGGVCQARLTKLSSRCTNPNANHNGPSWGQRTER